MATVFHPDIMLARMPAELDGGTSQWVVQGQAGSGRPQGKQGGASVVRKYLIYEYRCFVLTRIGM